MILTVTDPLPAVAIVFGYREPVFSYLLFLCLLYMNESPLFNIMQGYIAD